MFALIVACLLPASFGEQAITAAPAATACTGAKVAACTGHQHRAKRTSCHGSKVSCTGSTVTACTGAKTVACTGAKTTTCTTAVAYKVKVKAVRVHTRTCCTGTTTPPPAKAAPPPVPMAHCDASPTPAEKKVTEPVKVLSIILPEVERGHLYRRSVYFEPYVTTK